MAKKTNWLRTRQGQTASGLAALVLSYAFLSRAIDTGSYWQYGGGIVFLIAACKLFNRARKGTKKK